MVDHGVTSFRHRFEVLLQELVGVGETVLRCVLGVDVPPPQVVVKGAELCLTDDETVEPYRRVFAALARSAERGRAALEPVERARRTFTGPR